MFLLSLDVTLGLLASNDWVNGLVVYGSLPSLLTLDAPTNAGVASLVSLTSTNDVDEQAALLRGWNQTYNQLSAGSFSGVMLDANLHDLHLFREVTSNSLHQTGELTRDLIAVGVPLNLKGAATFCGRACDGSQLHIFSGREGFEFHSPSGLDIAGIIISRELLFARCTEREREFLEASLNEPHLRPTSPAGALRLRAMLTGAIEAMASTPTLASSPTLSSVLLNDVLTTLTEALTPELPSEPLFATSERRWQIVRAARHLASQSEDGSITVEEICEALGVSRRTLQYCFHEALGIRPAHYLRAVRLNGARRTLKSGGSVTDAATRWGFWHFGRFSQDYKDLFGELPSTTARRISHP